jgi:sugar O-acyltransferase (sialic acid O-acetyltransferase NeuD family)
MSELVLWGAGGHGKVVLDVARAMGGFNTISFIDDACEGSGNSFCACAVFDFGRYLQLFKGNAYPQCLVSIGSNEMRAACYLRALEHGLRPIKLVHPSSVISESAQVDVGTVVMAKVVINADAQIGKNCIVNTAAVVEHDCRIGDHVHLSPGVMLGGGVTVHSFAHLGIGAIALPGTEIGASAIVGAGAVVVNSVPSGATVVGIPARAMARTANQSNHS